MVAGSSPAGPPKLRFQIRIPPPQAVLPFSAIQLDHRIRRVSATYSEMYPTVWTLIPSQIRSLREEGYIDRYVHPAPLRFHAWDRPPRHIVKVVTNGPAGRAEWPW